MSFVYKNVPFMQLQHESIKYYDWNIFSVENSSYFLSGLPPLYEWHWGWQSSCVIWVRELLFLHSDECEVMKATRWGQ